MMFRGHILEVSLCWLGSADGKRHLGLKVVLVNGKAVQEKKTLELTEVMNYAANGANVLIRGSCGEHIEDVDIPFLN